MKLGPKGKRLIQSWETLVLFTYDDAKRPKPYTGGKVTGTLTIGYGHTAAAGAPIPEAGMKISKAEAERIFDRDIEAVVRKVNELVTREVSQEQFDALVSFQFNTGGLGRSTLLKKVNAGLFDQVPAEFMKWVNDNGKVSPGLINRRRAEVALWRQLKSDAVAPANTPVDAPAPPKPITQSKIANTSIGVGVAGGIEAANQFNQAVTTASATHDSVDMLKALFTSLSFWIAVFIVVAAAAVWYWRREMLQQEGV